MRTIRPLTLLGVLVLAGCSAAASPSPPPTAVPPTSAPTPTAAPSPAPAAAFTLDVVPPEAPAESRMAIPGSKYCFLVVVGSEAATPAPVTIDASAAKARVVEIRPAQLTPGTVGEVWVVADPATAETSGSVTITATSGGVTKTVTRSLPVFPMADERAADARPTSSAGRRGWPPSTPSSGSPPTRRGSRSSSRPSWSSRTTPTGRRTGR